MNNVRKSTPLLLALATALAMPLAFAQAPPTGGVPTSPPTTSTGPASSDSAQPAGAPADDGTRQLTWADVDTDGNGTIDKTESTALPSLAQVFDQADADADGQLSADEYKAFVAANAGATGNAGSAGGAD